VRVKVRTHTRRFERISRDVTRISRWSKGACRLLREASITQIGSRLSASLSCRRFGLLSFSCFRIRPLLDCGDSVHQGIYDHAVTVLPTNFHLFFSRRAERKLIWKLIICSVPNLEPELVNKVKSEQLLR
jgi:hypothetical protein